MRLLLDTHVAIWFAQDKERLHLGEAAILALIDPIVMPDFHRGLDAEFLPFTAAHAAATLRRLIPHKDPFDELLLVQAQEEGLRDTRPIAHPLAVSG